jgi:predicted nucleic acid-binding protein
VQSAILLRSEVSNAQLEAAFLQGPLLINDVVYAELAVRYDRFEELETFLDEARLEVVPIPRSALYLAAQVFARYRKASGSRTGVLPDFFIGAHAAITRLPLLTRDARRFPSLMLITP